ncbi:MAG TPA: PhnD/SsuA/transferrin family substrate-binding protein, partial [Blastocatellia bacterium]|nr:PhnD/SsuA/transferrin family substrate-binding protein [Blastocatellia bacterium]
IIDEPDWKQREWALDSGQGEIGFVCGLQYLTKPKFELLAAPVWSGARYAGRAVYFSDLIVGRDSVFRKFPDLKGSVLAYNEPTSHSGCNLIRYYLADRGLSASYFRRVVESGSHRRSIDMILDGSADVSAIDSTVLDLELLARPELKRKLRIIEQLGPSPAPPAIVSRSVPSTLKAELKNLFLTMHCDPAGREVLDLARLSKFIEVQDSDYDAIRSMQSRAREVIFP